MQQTETYKLKLIDTDDEFSPKALNENAKTLEKELARVDAVLDAKADQTALARVDAALGTKAEQTALAALDAAAARCVVFEHTGTGATTYTHTFGFSPQFVLMWQASSPFGLLPLARNQSWALRTNYSSSGEYLDITWTKTGVTLTASSPTNSNAPEYLCNTRGRTYYVLAIG